VLREVEGENNVSGVNHFDNGGRPVMAAASAASSNRAAVDSR
jgi:hypothetical protein